MSIKNPILPGFYPDPSICKAGDTYYLVNSSFDYFPGIPLFKSTDLANWQQIGHVLTRESQLSLKRQRAFPVSQGIYAPTIRYHEGRFYVITTNMSTMQTFFTWTDDPTKEWSEIVVLEGFIGYDPSLFFDDDGSVYLTTAALPWPGVSEEGIIQARINLETGQLLEKPIYIWYGSGSSSPEGPHLFKKDDWYYLTAAEGGTEFGHMQTIARSEHPFGPFENNPNNPIVSNRSTNLPLQAVGHADFVETDSGEWAAVMHGIRPFNSHKAHHLGRETLLAPVTWTEAGWPIVGNNGRVEVTHDCGHASTNQQDEAWTDVFDGGSLQHQWNTRGNLPDNSWSMENGLKLTGNAADLNSVMEPPVLIGCRQKHKDCKVSVHFSFEPTRDGEEAGITIFMNEQFHYDLFKAKQNDQQVIVLRKQIGDIQHIEKVIAVSTVEGTIFIEATPEKYTWFYQENGGKRIELGSGEARLLAKEIAGGFTGVYIGMYATGNGRPAESDAIFHSFTYTRN